MYPCPFDVQDRHDHNAAILSGKNIYAYEEEKLTSIKNEGTVRFSERSLMMGFKELRLQPNEVDLWVFPSPKKINLGSLEIFFTTIVKAYHGKSSGFKSWAEKHIKFIPHHISHASLGIFGSNFKNCMFLSMDGGGDFGDTRNFIFGEYKKEKLNILNQARGTNNIGSFHAFITDALGLSANESGKVSGLAGYGKIQDNLAEKFSNLLTVSKNGIKFNRKRYNTTKLNLDKIRPREYNRSKFINNYPSDTNIFRLSRSFLPHDIAATGEYIFRKKIIELLELLKTQSNSDNIVLSGGVFQNVTLNKYIQESKIFKNYYFTMASGDSGLSLGAALYIKSKNKKNINDNLLPAFLGPSYNHEEIEKILIQSRIKFIKTKDIEKKVANLISQGNCVGWFQGKAEYGPRSLGARSILADPRKKSSKSRINQLLKKRDWYMPYAPSIMREYVKEYMNNPIYSPYMQIALNIKEDKKKLIPAAIHVDGSSRVHVISKEDNKKYWKVINEFNKITGVPVILNTSFNRHGISTISDPRQAVEHLLDGCMDYLAIENFLISFKDNRIVKKIGFKIESESKCLKIDCINRLKQLIEKKQLSILDTYCRRLSNLLEINLRYENNIFILNGKKIKINNIIKNLLSKV